MKDHYMPMFVRGTGWTNSRGRQNISDYRTGGAVRLFDSARPAYSTNPDYNQPLCPDIDGEGDLDLGSPNQYCPNSGPGTYFS